MKVEQLYTGCLAEAAYYIESNGEAAIIDPLRETQPYLDKLEREGATLKYIFETHFHADFVSGHLDLAQKTGATIVYGPRAETAFDKHMATDGEVLRLGEVSIQVLHTPGHTPESTTYLLRDEVGKDYALFTGDTLFIGDVGRPDLAQKPGSLSQEDLAGWLYDSLREKIMPLADEVLVYPAHGAGSACGKNISSDTWDTLGNQKKTNYALQADLTREAFIEELTAGLMPPPQYFAKNAALNKMGYDSFDEVLQKGAVALSPEQFEAVAEQHGALILDTRPEGQFHQGFIPGAIFIGLDGSFAPWAGALITDLQQPILLVAPEGRAEEAITRLSRVGYDNTLGYLDGGMEAWKAAGKPVDRIRSITAETYLEEREQNATTQLLDVRKPAEFLSQHVADAHNFPLDFINKNMNRLQRDQSYAIHCLGGYRSMIMASILKARGFEQITDIKGGWRALEAAGAPVSDYACPTTIDQAEIDEAVAAVS